jgi:hypothetical protein
MLSYVATAAAGWIGVIALGFGGLLPFLLRRTALSRTMRLELAGTRPYLLRMWPHYWFGYVATGVSSIHAWLPMASRHTEPHPAGLWIATFALGILWVQVWSGLLLRGPLMSKTRALLRRFHFWGMMVFVVLIVLHIRING